MTNLCLLGLALCLMFPSATSGANVFVTSPFASQSHKNVFRPLIAALAARGHRVTVVSPFPDPARDNVTEVVIPGLRDAFEAAANSTWDGSTGSAASRILARADGLYTLAFLGVEVCDKTFRDPQFNRVLARNKFHVVLMSVFLFGDCFLAIGHKFKAPVIYVNMIGAYYWTDYAVGFPQPNSFSPSPILPFSQNMTYAQRFLNLVANQVSLAFLRYHVQPRMQAVAERSFGPLPSLEELHENVSFVLLNGHVSLDYPRPYMPNTVEVGAMHCREPRALPKDLEDWVTGSKNGFIYFSLGSAVQGKLMPEKFRKMFIEAFSRLSEYRILWKWETEIMDDLPKHVKLSKWLPQQDLLGHANIKLFITHGGLLSTQEATYHGVPVVGIPIGADQLNMKKTEMEGAGLTLEWSNLSADGIYNAVRRVLDEPSFRENLKRRSAIMKDQPETPLERAVFWTEYVIRHKGAPHLRSAARELTWYQYHLVDVWAFIILVLTLLVVGSLLAVRSCFRLCFGSKSKGGAKTKKGAKRD